MDASKDLLLKLEQEKNDKIQALEKELSGVKAKTTEELAQLKEKVKEAQALVSASGDEKYSVLENKYKVLQALFQEYKDLTIPKKDAITQEKATILLRGLSNWIKTKLTNPNDIATVAIATDEYIKDVAFNKPKKGASKNKAKK